MPVLLGLVLAAPLLLVFGALFVAADAVFAGYVRQMFAWLTDFPQLVARLILSLILAWRIYFLAAFVQTMIVMGAYLRGESEGKSRFLFGYSIERIVIFAGLLILAAVVYLIISATAAAFREFLAKEVSDGNRVEPLGVMDIRVRRNAFGRQRESFETELAIPALGEKPFPAVFIRAPAIEQSNGEVEVLARLDDGTIVAARQGKLLASAFHPELTDDLRFHRYFLDIVAKKGEELRKK
jgi:hypothetical protein